MADLRNLADWDPGVRSVAQIEGVGGGDGATFDVVVDAVRGELTLRYVTTSYDEPSHVVVEAQSRRLTSVDRITVVADATSGSVVTYDAYLGVNGRLGSLLDPVLGLVFRRIGRRAERGLRSALVGTADGE
jgi:Polyketide cyclase / dehydrase and lipid transport